MTPEWNTSAIKLKDWNSKYRVSCTDKVSNVLLLIKYCVKKVFCIVEYIIY